MWKFGNIGIAVKDAEATADAYCKLFGVKRGVEHSWPEGGVEKNILIPIVGNDVFIEILEPSEVDTPLKRFVEERGEGLYEIIWYVDDVDKALKELDEREIKVSKIPVEELNDSVYYIGRKHTSGVIVEFSNPAAWKYWVGQ